MPNLRQLAESDLATTLEGDFSMPVTITKQSDGLVTQSLSCRVVYSYEVIEEDTGLPVVVNQPMVDLRISSLTIEEPQDDDVWYFDVPSSPVAGALVERYVFENGRRGSRSIGFLQYPLKKYEDNRS